MAKVPERIGPYRVVAPLGRGGMGIVYEACDDAGQRVAVKTVRVARQWLVAAIRQETRALMRIHHPGVVRVLAEGVDGDRPWYAMELLEGETLRDFHARLWAEPAHAGTGASRGNGTGGAGAMGARPRAANGQLAAALAPMARLCRTLAFVHGEGIVHRDLKPENVFLREDETPVLMDFGIVTEAAGAFGRETLHVPGPKPGTVGYMAPEQIHGDPVDARADLYGLGCLLYELISGLTPFSGETVEVLAQHAQHEPVPLSQVVDDVPPELDALVRSLLAKEPRHRVGHADDVALVLERFTGPVAIAVRGRPFLYRPELVGRERARARLTTLRAAAEAGHGGCLYVGGESGIGKTALVLELARGLDRDKTLLVAGECRARDVGEAGGGALLPLRPLLELVADRCAERGANEASRLLGPHGAVLASIEPTLARVAASLPRVPELPPEAARQRLLNALRQTLEALARERALVLLLDDLQWADELTLAFLASLDTAWLAQWGVLVVGTYRSDEAPPALAELVAAHGEERLELERLEGSAVQAMVAGMLAWTPPGDLVRLLADVSEGNPFYVAEYLRVALSEGALTREPFGGWRYAGVAMLALPRGLRELVERRLATLSPSGQTLVAAGAVLGRVFPAEVAIEIAGLDDAAAADAMAELRRCQVLESLGDDLRFVHDKQRDVALLRLSVDQRRALHEAAGLAIEQRRLHERDPSRWLAALAHHFEVAGDVPRTLEYLGRSGDHALEHLAHAAAVDALRHALDLDERTRAGSSPAVRAHWYLGLARATFALGDLGAAEQHARAALAVLGEPLPEATAGWLRLIAREGAGQAWSRLPFAQVTPAGAQSADGITDAASAAELLTHRYYYVGNSLGMIGSALLSVSLAERAGTGFRVPESYAWLGYVAGLLRLRGQSERYFRFAQRGAERLGQPSKLAFALNVESVCRLGFAEWDAAQVCVDRAYELTEHDAQEREIALTIRGHLDYYRGRYDASYDCFERVWASACARRNEQHATWGLFAMGRALVAQGHWARAVLLLDEARARLETRRELDSEIICLGLSASAQLELGDEALARTLANAVLERVRGSRPAGFSVVDGYDGAEQVLLALAARHGTRADPRLLRDAKELAGASAQLARLFPMAGPTAALHAAQVAEQSGKQALAQKRFGEALRRAEALRMPRERASAEAGLARLESR